MSGKFTVSTSVDRNGKKEVDLSVLDENIFVDEHDEYSIYLDPKEARQLAAEIIEVANEIEGKLTDSARIAAAVAVLKEIEYLSKELANAKQSTPDACLVVKTDLLNRAGSGVLKALAILEGRSEV